MKHFIFSALLFACLFSWGQSQIDFNTNTTSGCAPLSVIFTNTSTAGSNFFWYFGDGTNANTPNASHTYTSSGTYFVEMQAYSAAGSYIGSSYEYIEVYGLSNSFYMEADSVCINDNFYVSAYNNTDSISVDFGDGSPIVYSQYSSAEHSYSSPGVYTITMTQHTPCGSGSISQNIYVGNNLPIVNPYMQFYDNPICPGSQTYLYTNWEYDYVFDYGDGSSGVNAYHSWAQVGDYVVTATLQNGCGNTATASDTIHITNGLSMSTNASVWVEDTACPNTSINFYADMDAVSYNWVLSNGYTSTEKDFDYTFQTYGSYNYQVTGVNGCGNDTTLYGTVVIDSTVQIDYIDLEIVDSVCFGEAVIIDLYASGTTSYYIDFGNGTDTTVSDIYYNAHFPYVYSQPGNYTITAYAINGCGNQITATHNLYVGTDVSINLSNIEIAAFPPEICPGDTTLLYSSPAGIFSNFTWDFGDGNSSSLSDSVVLGNNFTLDVTKYAYQNSGTYIANYTATNACGYTISENVTIEVGPGNEPEASLLLDYDNYNCLGEEIAVQGAGGTFLTFNFGDGSPDVTTQNTLGNVHHTYSSPGTYTITLTAKNNCGLVDSTSENITISGDVPKAITTTVDANCGQNNGMAVVSVSGGYSPYIINWSNGDMGVISDSLQAGIHQVVITDGKGCESATIATVSDEEAPTIALNTQIDVSCYGGNDGALDINVIGSTSPYTYSWSVGSSSQDISNLTSGAYELTVIDANGCIATKSYTITQPAETFVNFNGVSSDCGQNNGSLTAVVTGSTGPYSYSWDNGASTASIYNLGPGLYNLNVIDANGCLYTGTASLSEKNAPFIILDSLIQVGCGGALASIYISPIGGSFPYTYNWSDGTNNQDLINVQSGIYNVAVTGTNGCKAVQQYMIDESVPTAPNICMVTVDPLANHNLVVWEKGNIDPSIEWFRIYKESSQSGVYLTLDNIHIDSLSEYVDSFSDPTIHSWRYKIAGVDSCGNESILSSQHKTLHLTTNQGLNGDINLIWSHYVGLNYNTYNVWRYTNIDGWNMIQSLPNNLTSYTDNLVPAGVTSLHYYVEAVPDNGCTSTKANQNTTRSNRTAPISDGSEPPANVESIEAIDFVVYPNPGNGLITISASNSRTFDIHVFDMSGKLCRHKILHQAVSNLDLSDLQAGIYHLVMSNKDQKTVKKLVIQP